MRTLDFLSRSRHTPEFASISTIEAKRDQLAAIETRERDLVSPDAGRRMPMRHLDLPAHVFLRVELHRRLSCADAEPAFTAKLRPVGLGKPADGQAEQQQGQA
jgi:hypothetical protein